MAIERSNAPHCERHAAFIPTCGHCQALNEAQGAAASRDHWKAECERVEAERDEAVAARREIESKLESGYSFCHPEDDCEGKRAWLAAASERDELLEGIEAHRTKIRKVFKGSVGPTLQALYSLADLIKSKGPASLSSGEEGR